MWRSCVHLPLLSIYICLEFTLFLSICLFVLSHLLAHSCHSLVIFLFIVTHFILCNVYAFIHSHFTIFFHQFQSNLDIFVTLFFNQFAIFLLLLLLCKVESVLFHLFCRKAYRAHNSNDDTLDFVLFCLVVFSFVFFLIAHNFWNGFEGRVGERW